HGREPRSCRHHHGWQRAVGHRARLAAARRPPPGGGARALHRRGRTGARHPLPHALRLLNGELEAVDRGSHRADDHLRPLHPVRGAAALGRGRAPAVHRRARAAGQEAPEAHGRDRGAHGGQRPASPHRRDQLRRPRRAGARRTRPGRGRGGRSDPAGRDRRGGIRPPARHRRPARPRSRDPDQRRDAHLQLPALAVGLCRVRIHGYALARFHARRTGHDPLALQPARAPLRRRPDGMSDPAKWGDLLPRLISGAAMAAGGLALVWLGGPWFATLATVAGGLMVWELGAMTDRSRPDEAVMVGAVAAIILGVIFWTRDPYLVPLLLLPALYGTVRPKRPMRAVYAVYAALIMVACYGLVAFREGFGLLWLLWLILVVVVTDIAGYFAGRILGGPKFWPAISPKKTWSGTVAGWIAAAL